MEFAFSDNTRAANADPNTNGAVFVSASGHRNYANGTANAIGSKGHARSSTASTSVVGHLLEFTPTAIYPQHNATRSYGFPVRCIRD